MPTYEYTCKACGERVTDVRSITASLATDNCPIDGCAGKLIQLYGNIAVGFKGEGFYSTDKKTPQKKAGK
jgi:putative FmdB family regulatory protein